MKFLLFWFAYTMYWAVRKPSKIRIPGVIPFHCIGRNVYFQVRRRNSISVGSFVWWKPRVILILSSCLNKTHLSTIHNKTGRHVILKSVTGRPRAICGQRYPLPCFEWLWIRGRGIRAAAPKGTKSCRTQGDFCLSCLKKWMRCYRGLTEGLQ